MIPVLLALIFGINHAYADVIITTASGSGAPGCKETTNGCFYPSMAHMDIGETVIFSNTDSAAHTFTSGTTVPTFLVLHL